MATISCNTVTFEAIQAVVFDKDGTLADSAAFLRNLAQRRSRLIDAQVPGVQEPLLMAFGVDGDRINPNGLMAVGTRRENEIAAAAYVAETGRDWIDSLNLVHSAFAEADKYGSRKADHTPLFSGALELLDALMKADIKLALLSSDTSNNVREFIETYKLDAYFPCYLGVDDGPGKPDASLLQQVCQVLETSPSQTLVIGDSQADIQLAKAASAAGCIGATWGWATSPALQEAAVVANQVAQIKVVDTAA